MKIRNWCRNVAATLLAAGIWVPSVSYAVNIPLGDPSFEDYVVPAAAGYAYAADPAGAYRPTSAWVDDLDSPPGYTQDNGSSNWLYNAAYAESATNSRRGSPRTGDQAMHGLGRYSAQKTSAVFEANRTYTFSIWAQNDEILNEANGVFLYIFDGTVPFSDANSLEQQLITTINKRLPGMTAAQSMANWTQISISHTVAAGASEIGHPIGVGFFARKDRALDDASLTAVVPEPATAVLVGLGGVALLTRRRRP
jgi:hypothetical protein